MNLTLTHKRKTSFGLSLCTLLLGTALQAQAQTAVPGTLKVAMEVSYPPFESYDGDKIVGFDPELTAMLAREMKLKPVLTDTKFANLVLGLGGGQHDTVISGLYITAERSAVADVIPYASTGALIMVAKDSTLKPKTENDLCGAKVGLQAGSSWVKLLKTLSVEHCVATGKAPITVNEYPTAPEVSQALMSRNIDAQIEVAAAAKAFAEKVRAASSSAHQARFIRKPLASWSKKATPFWLSNLKRPWPLFARQGNMTH